MGCVAGFALGAAYGQEIVVDFSGPQGTNSTLVVGTDGNFYGTSYSGGDYGYGSVFKVTPGGILTTLASFPGGFDGSHPYGPLVQGNDGNFYGTTSGGGASGFGTVFRMTPGGVLTTLVSFARGAPGVANPASGLVQGTDGNFYGTTYWGGDPAVNGGRGFGTVYSMSPDGAETNLVFFEGLSNGAHPFGGLIQASDGNFYGTTYWGGSLLNFTNGWGTVFKMTAAGALTKLYAFDATHGGNPYEGLVEGSDGNFYGTTYWGGSSLNLGRGYGTAYKITPAGSFTMLVSFNGTNGGHPFAGLVQGKDGNFYGTTLWGGNLSVNGGSGYGSVFAMTPAGSLTTLAVFSGDNGAYPFAGLVFGNDGNLYGTTCQGGSGGGGVVFRVNPAAPLTITQQPDDLGVPPGSNAVLQVVASGTGPISYQWFSTSSRDLSLATNNTLLLTNVQLGDAGYYAVAANFGGSITSRVATVQVGSFPPVISFLALQGQVQTPYDQLPYGRHFYMAAPGTSSPANALGATLSISPGALVYLASLTSSGNAPFTYQWQRNGADLVGETNNTLGFPGVELAAGQYTVVVSDIYKQSTVSSTVTITVDPTFTKIMNDPAVTNFDQRTSSVGCAWGDYNNDGYPDLVTCGGLNNVSGKPQLFRNNRDGTFTAVTNGPPVDVPLANANTAVWVDYDNDGNLDLFIGTTDSNFLYHNDGPPNYSFSRAITGISISNNPAKVGATCLDFDNDGFVDLFLPTFDASANSRCFLYRNNGDGTFCLTTNAGDLVNDLASSVGCAAADYDNDGNIDLFVTGARGRGGPPAPNRLYHNNGDGTFSLAVNAGSIATDAGWMGGCAWGDYNNDGYPDLFVMGLSSSMLYSNNHDGTFTAISDPIVLDSPTGWFYIGNNPIACAWGDYDNDGFLDLFLTDENTTSTGGLVLTLNSIYHNNGDGTFTQINTGSPVNEEADSFGGSWVDYDNDGFLDLFATRGYGRGHYLYHNNLANVGNTNAWLVIKLVGTVSNRSAIGAKVRVKAFYRGASRCQMRQITAGSGYNNGGNELWAHFGLGDATIVDTMRIEWPSGTVQEFHNVSPRQILTYTEPPKLLCAAANAGQPPQFSIKGGRFMQYDIQASADLSSWSTITTLLVTNLDGTAVISDPGPRSDHRFYRAVSR
jgi:uncharacterized repeat protein (TIGR03803 family)